jgi:hypothetical protein
MHTDTAPQPRYAIVKAVYLAANRHSDDRLALAHRVDRDAADLIDLGPPGQQ